MPIRVRFSLAVVAGIERCTSGVDVAAGGGQVDIALRIDGGALAGAGVAVAVVAAAGESRARFPLTRTPLIIDVAACPHWPLLPSSSTAASENDRPYQQGSLFRHLNRTPP